MGAAPRRGGGARWDAAQMAVNDAAALSIGAAADVLTILEYHDSKDVRMARVLATPLTVLVPSLL